MGPPQRPRSAERPKSAGSRPKSAPGGVLEPETQNQLAASQLYSLESIAGMLESQRLEMFQTLTNHHNVVLHMVKMSAMPKDRPSKESSKVSLVPKDRPSKESSKMSVMPKDSPSKESSAHAQKNKRNYGWQADREMNTSTRPLPTAMGELSVPKQQPRALDISDDNDSSTTSMHSKELKASVPGQVDSDTDDSESQDDSEEQVAVQLTDVKRKEGLLAIKKHVQDMFATTGKKVDHYKDTGLAQKCVRHAVFEHLVMLVICLDSLWIGVDAALNDQDLLIDSHVAFFVMENIFCAFFVMELGLRFIAHKKDSCAIFWGSWFLLDGILVTFMVFEVWVVMAIMHVTGSSIRTFNPAFLRLVRILKFCRMARIVRLLRNVPEITILLRAVAVAARPVFFSQLLLLSIVYIFAIAFFHLLKETKAGDAYFSDLKTAMMTLLFRACFFDGLPGLAETLWEESVLLFFMLLLFVVVAPMTAVNLIIGILVKVVETLEQVETVESATIYLEDRITCVFQALDQNSDGMLDRTEFRSLMKSKEMVSALSECGLDVLAIAENPDIVFNGEEEIPLSKFLSQILSFRSDSVATVKDMFLMKRMILQEMEDMLTQSTSLLFAVRPKEKTFC